MNSSDIAFMIEQKQKIYCVFFFFFSTSFIQPTVIPKTWKEMKFYHSLPNE